MSRKRMIPDRESNEYSANSVAITFMTGVYNEEARIKSVLDHAVLWADEVIVINKSSTDSTKKICEEFGDAVKVVDVPYTIKGDDDLVEIAQFATHDWIFFGPASEIPTRALIKECRRVLDETNGELDLVYVPRKYYSFGVHNTASPWSISMFPFLINRRKAVIRKKIHSNFSPRDPNNIHVIPFSDDCCVYHWTHPTAKNFMRTVIDYFEVEAEDCENPHAKIQECMGNISRWEEGLRRGGPELFGHYCAWPLYWFGVALFTWERMQNRDVPQEYHDMREDLIRRDWGKPLS